ncbi:hypothetical protein R1sor_001697 [Riccia sorocarpa]|uniref:Uncharacterized protein n=1 Tax=Riccia sorocarpa TaxID=122646 RepID=A0ABD3GZU8_9MARC
MDPATSEVQEGDIPVAVDWVPPSSAVDDVTMDDTPVDVRVASLPASDHEVEEGEILDEPMDVLDSQAAVPPTLEAATAHVLIEDIPVAAVQAPMTSVVAEVTMATVEELVKDISVVAVVAPPTSADAEMTMGENPVEIGGAFGGQCITGAIPTTSEATTVEVGKADVPVAAVQAPPTCVAAEVTMGESVVVHGGAYGPTYDHEVVKRQLFHEVVPTTLEAQETTPSKPADSTMNPERFQELLQNIRSTRNDPHPVAEGSTPTKIQDVQQEVPTPGTAANLDKVVLDVSDYLPIVSPDVTQNARESSGISNDREMLKVLNNFYEAVPLEQDLQTSAPPVESDTPESSTRVPDPKVASGPQSEADLEAIGRENVVESIVAAKDDTERGLPMNVAIGVPFDVESMREYFPSYKDKQWACGKINIVTHCTDQFLLDNWENWFRTSIGGRIDGFRAEVRKNFLFFAGLEKHGLKVDWTTVDKSRNVREISAADRHTARVNLWKRKTVFKGGLLYPEKS